MLLTQIRKKCSISPLIIKEALSRANLRGVVLELDILKLSLEKVHQPVFSHWQRHFKDSRDFNNLQGNKSMLTHAWQLNHNTDMCLFSKW